MKRALEIREAAAKAFMARQDAEAVKRTADTQDFAPGEVVYLWRDTSNFIGWSGPGFIVATSSNGRSLWLQVTSEESLGLELALILSAEMLDKLEKGTPRNYKDIQAEGGPLATEAEFRGSAATSRYQHPSRGGLGDDGTLSFRRAPCGRGYG